MPFKQLNPDNWRNNGVVYITLSFALEWKNLELQVTQISGLLCAASNKERKWEWPTCDILKATDEKERVELAVQEKPGRWNVVIMV